MDHPYLQAIDKWVGADEIIVFLAWYTTIGLMYSGLILCENARLNFSYPIEYTHNEQWECLDIALLTDLGFNPAKPESGQ